VDALKSEFGRGLILPPKEAKAAPKTTSSTSSSAAKAMKQLSIDKNGQNQAQSKPATTLDGAIEVCERFKCTALELYNVLTVKEMAEVFTAGSVDMKTSGGKDTSTAEEGVSFQMLGGNIQGEFIQLEPFTRVVQRWRLSHWPSGHYSRVEFRFSQGKEDTTLTLKQTSVPSNEVERTKEGWYR